MHKKTIGLQCHQTIPRHVTIIHDNRIDLNEKINVFKDLNEVPPSDDWFWYEYIDAEFKYQIDETKWQLAGDGMKKKTKHYMEYLNQDPNWLKKVSIEIDKFLINHEYIDFFMQMYMQLSKYNGSNSSLQTLIITCLPRFEKLDLSQFKVYIETETTTHCFVCCNSQKTILFWSAEGKDCFLYFTHVKDPYWFAKVGKEKCIWPSSKKRIHLKLVNHALSLQG